MSKKINNDAPTPYESEAEFISALVDGQLSAEHLPGTMALLARDESLRLKWRDYHVTGELLRASDLVIKSDDTLFMANLRNRLARDEPAEASADAPPVVHRAAANDGQFRWKALAGVATLAAVGALGWGLLGRVAPPAEGVAQAVPDAPVTAAAPMIRDPHLDELLAAHRQWGGGAALQLPAGFLRNATFDGPTR